MNKADLGIVAQIYDQVENGVIGDWSIIRHMIPLIQKRKQILLKRNDRTRPNVFEKEYSFIHGFASPILLVDAAYTWFHSGKKQAFALIADNAISTEKTFVLYLTNHLTPCYQSLVEQRNCLDIIALVERYPFNDDIAFLTGVTEAKETFLVYARELAKMHTVIKYGYAS